MNPTPISAPPCPIYDTSSSSTDSFSEDRKIEELINALGQEIRRPTCYEQIPKIAPKLYGKRRLQEAVGSNPETQVKLVTQLNMPVSVKMNRIQFQPEQSYIASPYPSNQSWRFLLWHVARQYLAPLIVNLCQDKQVNTCKFENYLKQGEERFTTGLTVCPLSTNNPLVQKFKLSDDQNVTYTTVHHYPIWRDGNTTDTLKLLELVHSVMKAHEAIQELSDAPPPIIVHCKAGVGRTGTFILVYDAIRRITRCIEEGRSFEEAMVKPADLAKQLHLYRMQRGDDRFVQTTEQWKLACECIRHTLLCLPTNSNDDNSAGSLSISVESAPSPNSPDQPQRTRSHTLPDPSRRRS